MKKREIRIWLAAAAMALGMGLSGCSADSVDTGAQSGQETGQESEQKAEQEAEQKSEQKSEQKTKQKAEQEVEQENEQESGQKTEQDADDAVLLSEGAMEDGVYEGIVVDASMNNFAIRTEDGVTSFMERPEQGGTLKDGLLLGIPVKVVIEGQAVTELTDGEKQPQSGREALNFAVSVMDVFRYEDMGALTTLIKYPADVVLEGDMVYRVEDAAQLEEIGAEKIFTEELKTAVRSVNLYELKADGDGSYVMGQEEGGCRVIFEADEDNDRGFSIRSIEGPIQTNTVG